MKQTAVEWLLNKIESKNGKEFSSYYTEFIEQAKEMEKEQIIDAHLDGQCFSTTFQEFDYAEYYYNKTFNK